MTETFEMVEEMVVSDPDTLKVLADTLRLQIVRVLKRPRTVKELGAVLDMPPTKLYYHVNQLEKVGLIRVVETNVVSGIIEKVYQVPAKRIRVNEAALMGSELTDEGFQPVLTALFDSTKEEVLRAVRQGAIKLPGKSDKESRHDVLVRGHARLTSEQVAELHGQLEAVLAKFEQAAQENLEREDLHEYVLLEVFFPMPEDR